MPQLPEVTLSTLFLFKEQQKKLYLQKVDRDKQHRFRIFFSAEPDSLPQLYSLNDSLHYHTFYSPHRDSLTVWLTDSMSIAQDSLFFEIRYRQTDSLYNLEWFTDTLRIIWREPKLTAKAKEAQEREARNRRLELKTNAKKDFEIYDTLRLTCTTPLAEIVADSIHLLERVDTVFKPIPFSIAYVDTLPMTFALLAELKPEGKYELRLDSAALHDIYGISHVAAKYPLEVKALTDYSTLRVKVTPFDTRIRIQLAPRIRYSGSCPQSKRGHSSSISSRTPITCAYMWMRTKTANGLRDHGTRNVSRKKCIISPERYKPNLTGISKKSGIIWLFQELKPNLKN